MKIKCEYCGNYINDTDAKCSGCGADNIHLKRVADGTPKTIEELRQWYIARNLPPEDVTRFYIGKNYKFPKAFGIYEENGQFIVYKNKANGQRAIRYQGTDQAYAVNELFLKLKSEILNQKAMNSAAGVGKTQIYYERKKEALSTKFSNSLKSIGVFFASSIGIGIIAESKLLQNILSSIILSAVALCVLAVIVSIILVDNKKGHLLNDKKRIKRILIPTYIVLVILIFLFLDKYRRITYYRYGEDIYCSYQFEYYEYDGYGDYYPISKDNLPYDMQQNMDAYKWNYSSSDWNSSYFTEFEDSNYYDTNFHSSDSGSDSSYDWDSGSSWDSGGTDWDSDW